MKELSCNKEKITFNLSTLQRKAVNRLRIRRDIAIKASNKSSGVCVLTPTEALHQLQNEKHYKQLDQNLILEIQHKIRTTIEKHVITGAIPQGSANHLIVNNPIPAKIYLLPKVHKNMEKPPSRPIMAGNGHRTEHIAEYIAELLKEHINKIPLYIEDTNHFLNICQNTVLPHPHTHTNARIVTFDASPLYTSIPHEEGVMALGEFMSNSPIQELLQC